MGCVPTASTRYYVPRNNGSKKIRKTYAPGTLKFLSVVLQHFPDHFKGSRGLLVAHDRSPVVDFLNIPGPQMRGKRIPREVGQIAQIICAARLQNRQSGAADL